MNTKTLATLSAVLAALVLIAWMSGAFESDPSTLDVPDLAVESEAVESIEILAPQFATTVNQTAGRWTLAGSGHPADSVTVRTLLNAFEELEATSVVSRSPDRYARYGVDSSATYVRLRTDDGDREFRVASRGGDSRSGYIRTHGDERVFMATPRISIPTGMNRWRDRRIFTASPATVDRVDLDSPDGSIAIYRTDGAWSITNDGAAQAADSAAVVRYLRNFQPFRVDGFLERFDDLAPETHSLSVTLQDGSTWTLGLREQDGALAARVSSSPSGSASGSASGSVSRSGTGATDPFRVLSSRLSTLFPDAESLAAGE